MSANVQSLVLGMKRSSQILDFVGNSERFNEGYVPPREVEAEPDASCRGNGGAFVLTVEAKDAWIWREWFDVEPGGEAMDGKDLAGKGARSTISEPYAIPQRQEKRGAWQTLQLSRRG